MNDSDDSTPDPVAAAIAALGEPLSVHRVAGRQVQLKMTIGMGLIILGIVINVLWYTVGPAKFGHAFSQFLFMPLAFGFGLVGQVIWNRGVTVYTYPVGVLRIGRGKVETFLWEEITAIKVRSDSMKIYGERNDAGEWRAIWLEGKIPMIRLWTTWLELTRNDGTTLKLTPLIDDYEGLSRRIQEATFVRMWPAVREKLASGEPVAFGPVVASADGITLVKSHIPWSEMKKVELKGRVLTLGGKSFWRSGKAGDISTFHNPHVLFAAMEEQIGSVLPIQILMAEPTDPEVKGITE